jgi:hypothetical protein
METTIVEHEVLDFVKKELQLFHKTNLVVSFYGVKARDIVKFIEHPEKCGNWPFDFVGQVMESIKKIKKKYVIPYPTIEKQTEEDRVLSRLLSKNEFLCFGTTSFFKGYVNVEHVIQYMERNEAIKNWNAYFLCNVMAETQRVKAFLL